MCKHLEAGIVNVRPNCVFITIVSMCQTGAIHDGTDFVLAFGKAKAVTKEVELILISDSDASVTIEWPTGITASVDVSRNVKTSYKITGNMRVSGGIENKAFHVNSTRDIRIVVSNFNTGGDAYLAFPFGAADSSGNFTFMAAAHEPESSSNYGKSFFVVASGFDDTDVTIYAPSSSGGWEVQETVTLSRLQTKVVDSKQSDITGSLITANKPISVVSGMDYSRINSINGPDSMYLSVPPIQFLSNRHIVPPIAGRDNAAGYFVRVISAADDNTIHIYNNSGNAWMDPILESGGQLEEVDVSETSSTLSINCSHPCLVVQYNKGGGAPGASDPFMLWIPSIDLFTFTNTTFYTLRNLATSSNTFNNYIAMVTLNPDGNDLFYDGITISGWETVAPWNDYQYTEFSVEDTDNAHEIGSLSRATYLVWVNGHASNRAYGYLATAGGEFHLSLLLPPYQKELSGRSVVFEVRCFFFFAQRHRDTNFHEFLKEDFIS